MCVFQFFCDLEIEFMIGLEQVLPLALNNYLHFRIFSSLSCLSKSMRLGLKNFKYSALENIKIGGLVREDLGLLITLLKICTNCGMLCMLGSGFLPGTSMLSKITALKLL